MTCSADRKPELLAPAGGPEAAMAALTYGADAVYLGVGQFSARAEAVNFSLEELADLVGYAHAQEPRQRVFAAVNTLILEDELGAVLETLDQLDDLEVDAVIVQDVGVARLARTYFPSLRLHASTQLAAHNAAGVRELAAMGFARAVLAREVTRQDLRVLRAESPIELEVFIHGALCYAYSGLCLFSAMTRGRSGNRGRCAYGCRESLRTEDADRNLLPFSMRDLGLGEGVRALAKGGVDSLKIEGRMKSPLYVAAVTDYYRRLLDGTLSAEEARACEEAIRTIFSRPWTTLGLGDAAGRDASPIESEWVGHRGAPIGQVAALTQDRGGSWLHFRSRRALEKHDGLQLDLAGSVRPFGFAIDTLCEEDRDGRLSNPTVRTPAGVRVAVRLPFGHPPLPEAAAVYCSSSQEVKRSFPYPALRHGAYLPCRPIDVAVAFTPEGLRATAISRSEATVCEAAIEQPETLTAARQPEKTEPAVRKAFERTGQTEWAVADLRIENSSQLFASASMLNEARRRLMEALSAQRTAQRAAHLQHAQRDTLEVRAAPSPNAETPPGWSLKIHESQGAAVLDHLRTGSSVDEVVIMLDHASAPEAPWSLREALLEAGAARVRFALPPIIPQGELVAWAETVGSLMTRGATQWEAANVGAMDLLREAAKAGNVAKPDLTADWTLYTLNHAAFEAWTSRGASVLTTSPEASPALVSQLLLAVGGEALQILLFQQVPLFLSAHAPAGCEDLAPETSMALAGRPGRSLRVFRRCGLYVTVEEQPRSWEAQRAAWTAQGACRWRFDLSWTPPEETAHGLARFSEQQK